LRGSFKLRVIFRLADRFVSLEVEYHVSLTKVGIHLVSLQELQETSFLIFMHVNESSAKSKIKRVKSWPPYISNIINKFLDILVDKLLKHLSLLCNVDHKIKVVLRSTPPFKLPYRLYKKNYKNLRLK
jgi:hypothetical protein